MLSIQFMPVRYNFYKGSNKPKKIVIHDTGNPKAGALNHQKYFGGGNRGSSAHYFVDNENIIQIIADTDGAWHCGDGRGRYGITNTNSLGIEMCLTGNMEVTISHTVELTAHLMKKHGIGIDDVVRHYDASRKSCPNYMNKNRWSRWFEFKEQLKDYIDKGSLSRPGGTSATGNFKVYQGSANLGTFSDLKSAIKEGKKWANSTVLSGTKVVWRFRDLYRVFQHSTHLGDFDTKDAAINEALKWKNSRIEQCGNLVWSWGDKVIYKGFRVLQHKADLGTFTNMEDAIKESLKWNNSRIEHSDKVYWRYEDRLYKVAQQGVQLGAFESVENAIVEAKKWAGSIVTQNREIVWKFVDK